MDHCKAQVIPTGSPGGPLQIIPPAPHALISQALELKADPATLERLLALQERWEANEARKAYVQAMARFKAECPPVLPKNKHVSFRNKAGILTDYWHTTLDKVVETVQPLLASHGLHHEWRPVPGDNGMLVVSCRVSHSRGHFEEVSLSGAPDNSGGKNSVQMMGSTLTYLQRYTLLSLLGLSTAEEDDDGRGHSAQPDPPRRPASEERPERHSEARGSAPSQLVLDRLEHCRSVARARSGSEMVTVAATIDKALAKHARGELGATFAATLYGKAKDALRRSGWTEPADWAEQRKARAAERKSEQQELAAEEPEPQEPDRLDDSDVVDEPPEREREPGED